MDPKKDGDSSPEGRIPQRVTRLPVTAHLQGVSSELKKNLQTTKSRERRTYRATSAASLGRKASSTASRTKTPSLGLKALELFKTTLFSAEVAVATVSLLPRRSQQLSPG